VITVALTLREELLELKELTRKAAEDKAATHASTTNICGHDVECRSELKVMKQGKVVRLNTWRMDGRRMGENHLFGTLEKL
jgi:hypothetical protein